MKGILCQNGCEPYEKQYHNSWTALTEDLRGHSWFQVTGMVEWGQKWKPKKIPSASNNNPPPTPLKTTTTKHGPKFNPPKFPYWISEPYQLVLWNRCNVMHGILKQAWNNAAGIHTGTNTNLEMVWKTQKFPHNQEATQKNTCQIFQPPKIPGIKISNPKKCFDHPRHLKSRIPPYPLPPLDWRSPSLYTFNSLFKLDLVVNKSQQQKIQRHL